MGVSDACFEFSDGVRIEVEVVPNASDPGFPAGYNEWRKRVQARVRAQPRDGAANSELVDLIAAAFNVPPADVGVVSGHASRRKSVVVRGVDRAAALALLEGEVSA